MVFEGLGKFVSLVLPCSLWCIEPLEKKSSNFGKEAKLQSNKRLAKSCSGCINSKPICVSWKAYNAVRLRNRIEHRAYAHNKSSSSETRCNEKGLCTVWHRWVWGDSPPNSDLAVLPQCRLRAFFLSNRVFTHSCRPNLLLLVAHTDTATRFYLLYKLPTLVCVG